MLTQLGILAVVSLTLHGAWEYLHVSLYAGYEHITDMPIALYATIGDVAYTLGVTFVIFLFRKNIFTAPTRSDLFLLAVAGFLIALFVEYKALMLGRWVYLDAMPIIPILNVGLTPVLQMTILLLLSVFLTSRILHVLK